MNDMVLEFSMLYFLSVTLFNITRPSQLAVSTSQVNTLMVLWPQSLEFAASQRFAGFPCYVQ